MTSESTLFHGIVQKTPDGPPKPSNEDMLYGIGGSPYPPGFFIPRQPRLPHLKTYSRKVPLSKLKSVTTASTAGKTPNESRSSVEPSPHNRPTSSSDDGHDAAPTEEMQIGKTRVDDPIDIPVLTARPCANSNLSTKSKRTLKDRLIARDNTPRAARMDRRRQESRGTSHQVISLGEKRIPAGTVLIAKRRPAVRKDTVTRGQTSRKTAPEPQAANRALPHDQQDGSQYSNGTEESLNLEETLKKARQTQAFDGNKCQEYNPDAKHEGTVLVEFEDEDSDYAALPVSEESPDIDENIRNPHQRSRSLLGTRPMEILSSRRFRRRGNPPAMHEVEDEDEDSAQFDSSNQE